MHNLNGKKSFVFSVNAFEVEAQYFESDIQNIFIPLLSKISSLKKDAKDRVIVFISAPPGVGKTTLSLFLEYLSKNDESLEEIQSIGMDGFHYPQEYLKNNMINVNGIEVTMKEVKGSPETFDFNLLKRKIMDLKKPNKEVKWPIYDRKIHDVVPEQISIKKNIVVLEGNWLLLNEENWRDLNEFCDYSIFITAQLDMLRERLIQRKMNGGLSKQEALEFYEFSDRKNVERILNNKIKPNLHLEITKDGKYSIRR